MNRIRWFGRCHRTMLTSGFVVFGFWAFTVYCITAGLLKIGLSSFLVVIGALLAAEFTISGFMFGPLLAMQLSNSVKNEEWRKELHGLLTAIALCLGAFYAIGLLRLSQSGYLAPNWYLVLLFVAIVGMWSYMFYSVPKSKFPEKDIATDS